MRAIPLKPPGSRSGDIPLKDRDEALGRSPNEAQWGTMDPQVNQQFMLLNMAIYAIEIVDLPIKMFIDFP